MVSTRHKRIIGFTLLELMVVIGIISIVGMFIGPRFKKAYDDFLMRETLSDVNTLMSSCRSYYLIYNEFPEDSNGNYIFEELAPFVPSNYFNKTKTREKVVNDYRYCYQLTISPFNDANLDWDYNNWLNWDSNATAGCMYLSVLHMKADSEKANKHLDIFKKQYPLYTPTPLIFDDVHAYVCIPFPEFPLKASVDSNSKNRYY